MALLSEKQKKRIVADRVDGMSFRKLAAKYGVSTGTIQKVLKRDPDFTQKITQKKEQDTLDMLDFLDSRKSKAQKFIDLALEQIQDPEKLDRASVQTIATALGIVIDKFTAAAPKQKDEGVKVIIDV